MHTPSILFVVAVFAASPGCTAQGKADEALVQRAKEAKLTLAEAIAKGQKEAGEGTPYQGELELGDRPGLSERDQRAPIRQRHEVHVRPPLQ